LHHSSLGWKPLYASKVLYLSVFKAVEAACTCGSALQAAMLSQQAQCVRLVVDALLEGRFSKVSVVLHMYEALQALIHDPQVTRPSLLLHEYLPWLCSATPAGRRWLGCIISAAQSHHFSRSEPSCLLLRAHHLPDMQDLSTEAHVESPARVAAASQIVQLTTCLCPSWKNKGGCRRCCCLEQAITDPQQ